MSLLFDSALAAPLEALAAIPAAVQAPARGVKARGRLRAAGLHGRMRWALHRGDRRWVAGRFALPLLETPHQRRVHRVGLRHYALTQRCMTVESDAALRGAVGLIGDMPPTSGRTIFAFAHSPAMWVSLYGLTNVGLPVSPVVEDWFFEDAMAAVRTDAVARSGGRVILAGDAFTQVQAALQDGGIPAIAVDVAGSTPVRFLGKDARVRSGIARLAQATGASIVPMRGAFVRGRPVVVLDAPIAPRDDHHALLRDVVAAVEAPVLERPEYWMPYTGDLWPDRCAPFRDAYAEDPPLPEVGSPT
ncbi:hypothetical protein LRS13_08770 [Svornostia abyssi]|uniref:Acyltransferase n=1 Tax=Svornostia abyssi TaxID=2898438 RepID=A0ABY5PM14_9ACTN|nr:hypothetical protein LRS13_08770 [Parviterribacteraceae bacterium J379]